MPGHNVLCGAAWRGAAKLARSLAVSEFSPLVPKFSLVPSCDEKNQVCPPKKRY